MKVTENAHPVPASVGGGARRSCGGGAAGGGAGKGAGASSGRHMRARCRRGRRSPRLPRLETLAIEPLLLGLRRPPPLPPSQGLRESATGTQGCGENL